MPIQSGHVASTTRLTPRLNAIDSAILSGPSALREPQPSIAALGELLKPSLGARLYLRQVEPAVLQELTVLTEAAQATCLGEDSHGDHRANARQRVQMGEVDIVMKLRLGACLNCCSLSLAHRVRAANGRPRSGRAQFHRTG